MVLILDSGGYNLTSVCNAFDRINCKYKVVTQADEILGSVYSHIVLPGVGRCDRVITKLKVNGIWPLLPNIKKPFLGICVGYQVLFEDIAEGDTSGLSVFSGNILKFPDSSEPVPKNGWDQVRLTKENQLFLGIEDESFFYFNHSYYASSSSQTMAQSDQGMIYSCASFKDNFYGVQFHPEKSAAVGEKLLKNFLNLGVKK